ncbi:MAG: CotH kinase family protein, partial [Planctomycetota bacterium]|nr:CotH kinase family protein [Planctomycetota bacterium]
LSVDYDDGFVAYLNGQEVARANLGNPGDPVLFDQPADGSHEAGSPDLFGIPRSFLETGENVLAVETHNGTLGSSDASFIPRLVARPPARPQAVDDDLAAVVINEVRPTETGGTGFVELYNRAGEPFSVAGYRLIDSAGHSATLPAVSIDPGSFAVLTDSQLGFDLALSGVTYALVEEDGRTLVDALNPRPGRPGESGFSFGRFPDGDDDGFVLVTPTGGAPNQAEFPDAVLMSEIQFHPPTVPPDDLCPRNCSDVDQWIELHNRSDIEVDIGGWSLTKAVRYDIPVGTRVAAAGFLVVASSRQRFLATHPGFDATRVLGGWLGRLAHDSDTINLRDDLGNLVDHVKYGDGAPRNDEEPEPDGVDDGTFRGSDWPTDADGSGRTLELVHVDLDNRFGGSWREGAVGGTPGAPNGSAESAPPPVVASVTHFPPVPFPQEPVTVTSRISSVGDVAAVEIIWQRDDGSASGVETMLDDGLSGDGAAGDGTYGGQIPGQPNRAVVTFQVEARTTDGRSTLVPSPPPVDPYPGFAGPFFLYQSLPSMAFGNSSPAYFIVMRSADEQELETRDEESDVLLPATFIARPGAGRPDEVRHVVGLRFRGAQARRRNPKSYRISFASERRFEEMEHLNLNSQDVDSEIMAADLFLRAGIPSAQEWTVNLTFQGDVPGPYVRKERLDADFLERFFGGASDHGNLYRAIDPDDNARFPRQGDLSYLGPDPEEYRPYYAKRSNRDEDDYSDIVALTGLFDPVETPDEVFTERLEALVDVFQWARFFAVQSAIANSDGGIQNRTGEDYYLYRMPSDSPRRDAGKWLLVPWDIEESFSNRGERLFPSTLLTVRRFLTHPKYAPFYYCNLVNLREGVFSRFENRQRLRLIEPFFGFGTIDGIDSFVTARLGFFDENIPAELSAGAADVTGQPIVDAGDVWRFFKGTEEPSPGLEWAQPGFVDTTWLEGPTGIGYGDGDDATVLDDMQGSYTTVYLRREFQVPAPQLLSGLEFLVDFDDAFVAYLNGTEVARGGDLGDPGTRIPFDGLAGGNREAGNVATFDVSAFVGDLVAGTNVLAVQGVNGSLDSSDFSIIPRLADAARSGGGLGCGDVVYAVEDVVHLEGRSDACSTASVRVGSVLAEWDPFLARWTAQVPVVVGENVIELEAFDLQGNLIDSDRITVQRLEAGLTPVSGDLPGDTTWTADGGPYLLTEDVVVPAGTTLRIEGGTVVVGRDRSAIVVRGLIRALGTEDAPIVFRSRGCADLQGGIAIDATGTGVNDPTHLLRFCSFEHGFRPRGFNGFVAPVRSKILIDHCTFRFLAANAVDGTEARVEVRNSLFESTQEGVHCTRSTVVVLDSTFRRMIGDRDAIDFDFNGSERSRIEGCFFAEGADDGIDLGDATVDIIDNVFFDFQDKALSLEGNGPLGPPTVTGNLIVNCGTGIALKNGVTIADGHHNTLVGNQEGIHLFAKANASDGGHGDFHSMIVWNNTVDVQLDRLSTVSFTHSDISGRVWPGEGNISADPGFVDANGLDFSLRPGSPSIGTGKDASDMGAIPFNGAVRTFVRGDADRSGVVNISDAVRTLDFLFRKGPGSLCLDSLDSNDDGDIDVSDPIYTLLFLFAGGGEPPAPFPEAGVDSTGDGLGCF